MRLRPHQRVPLEVARSRALACLAEEAAREYPRLLSAAWVAMAIWPDNQMRAQGAGAAASRILKTLKVDGLVVWEVVRPGEIAESWGYCITRAGAAKSREG